MRFLDTSHIRTEFDCPVFAADGTRLSVDIYLPAEPGCYPALLVRTAADNNRLNRLPGSVKLLPSPAERWKALACQGFVVAAADVRGRGDSDGMFHPFTNEAADGVATIEWVRRLAECNGKVGVFGTGYGAFCAWAALAAGADIDAIASISPFGLVGEGLCHRGGVVRLDWLFWMHLIGGRTLQPAMLPPWREIHRHLPLRSQDEELGREDIWWKEWLSHLSPQDSFWEPLNLADKIAARGVPGLHLTGWWDGYGAAAHYYYEAARRSAAPQRLIVGPWDTAGVRHPGAQVGGFNFGPRSVVDIDEALVDFFDHCLNSGCMKAESRLFITGRNAWATVEANYKDSNESLSLYLSSTMGANTRRGDGLLSHEPPVSESMDSVTHNPAVPIEFQPEFISFSTGANPSGFSLDQSHITSRDEALVYTSKSLEQPISVLGVPRVTLTVRTTAADADLYVLLSDSFPLGARDLHLGHSAIRLATIPTFRPGELLTIELQLDAIAHDFLKGHQIRVTVTPSLFPLYARNLHGRDYIGGCEITLAEIELHHGSQVSAFLSLPLAHVRS